MRTWEVRGRHNSHRAKCLIHDRAEIKALTTPPNHLLIELLAHPHGWLAAPRPLSYMEHLAQCSVYSGDTGSIGTWLAEGAF